MKMTDSALAVRVEALRRQSVGLWDSKLSKERTTVQRYYDGLEPATFHAGDSKYVSADVYDGVESMKAQLLEVFGSTSTPITFAPQGQEDVQLARAGTEYCSYAIFRQNPGFNILQTVIEDGLKARVGIVKVWWDEDFEDEESEVSMVPYADFEAALASDQSLELDSIEMDSETQTVTAAKLVKRHDRSQVRVEAVEPETFGISRMAKSAETADIVFHRVSKTADDLERMGISKKLIAELRDEGRAWAEQEPDKLERFNETDDGFSDYGDRDNDDTARRVEVTEAYCRMDLDGRPKLWRILMACGKVLQKDVAKRLPFVFFTPLPRPHSFWGASFAKKIIPTQNARTLLTRSIINHALITNNPRTGVVKGGLMNPKELTENRIGGLVNLTRPDALVPIIQTGLNPFVFQTIELLDAKKEETTGVSRLSQGLSKDAVSKQNSADMVDGLIGRSMIRQKICARNFAEQFLKNLYLEVYRLIIENEKTERIIEIAGEWTPVDPASWPDRKDVVAEVSVGYGEREKETQKWLAVDSYMAQDPRFQPVYTPDRRYHVISQVLRSMGIKDVNSVVADPSTIEPPKPPEPSALEQAETAVKTSQARAADAQAQATVQKLQIEQQKMQLDHQVAMEELRLKNQETMMKLEIEKLKLEQHRVQFQKELALAEKAAEQGNLTGNASPDA
jgi:hypothetical protein